jgi:hypothetical protein
VYTEKIDCFSFGVIIVQTSTRQFPKPGNRRQRVEINHPGLPQGTLEVRLAEIDRRQNHISQIDPNYPLLPVALDCLKDKDTERPSAQQLCERVASLKERPEYSDSVAAAQQERQQLRQQPQQREIEEKERQLGQLREQLQQLQQSSARERHQLQQNLAEENERQLEQLLAAHREEIERITKAKDNERERQLESSEYERNELEKRIHEFEKELLMWRDRAKETQHLKAADKVDKRDNIKLRWREGGRASFASNRWTDAVVDGNRVYIIDNNSRLWMYDINGKCWLLLSNTPYRLSGFVIFDGLPTTIGGDLTNKLMSLTAEGKWTEKFPPMPTERYLVSAVCSRTDLIATGGEGKGAKTLTSVEVLNIENLQWSTAVDLPEPLQYHSATVCGDQLYMLGGINDFRLLPTKSVYTCSVSALLQSCTQRSLVGTFKRTLSLSDSRSGVWSKLPDLPVRRSTCVTFCGQLLAVCGVDSGNKPTTAVYMYNQATNSWNIISHMATARWQPFAAILPNNQLIVVGGITERLVSSDTVEFGSLY